MDYTGDEVLRFVSDNGVKFVKLAFTDIFGRIKNLNIFADELGVALERGIPVNGFGIDGFSAVKQDEIYLKPAPGTLCVLPWRPHEDCVARLQCDIVKYSGESFEGDSRNILKSAVRSLKELGYACDIESSCEFYLFKTNASGDPTFTPHDYAGYLDAYPIDKGENVRRDICLTLEEMEIIPKTSHHEGGPGQNEIDFTKNSALSAADDMNTYKYVVKAIAERNGLYASFMPKPLDDENGSGLHLGLMLYKDGQNVIKNSNGELTDAAKSFMFGILKHIREITIFANPLANSYERFGSGEAPDCVDYSSDSPSSLIRINRQLGDDAKFILRSPDSACNQYLTIALLLYAGAEGIKCKYTENDVSIGEKLPVSLDEAIKTLKSSDFIGKYLDSRIIDSYIIAKTKEWEMYSKGGETKSSLLQKNFFTI